MTESLLHRASLQQVRSDDAALTCEGPVMIRLLISYELFSHHPHH